MMAVERGIPVGDTPIAPVDDLSAKLRPAILRVSRRLRAEKADHELSDSQSAILAYIDNHGPSTPGTLASFERVTPPSMNRTINAVVEAGTPYAAHRLTTGAKSWSPSPRRERPSLQRPGVSEMRGFTSGCQN